MAAVIPLRQQPSQQVAQTSFEDPAGPVEEDRVEEDLAVGPGRAVRLVGAFRVGAFRVGAFPLEAFPLGAGLPRSQVGVHEAVRLVVGGLSAGDHAEGFLAEEARHVGEVHVGVVHHAVGGRVEEVHEGAGHALLREEDPVEVHGPLLVEIREVAIQHQLLLAVLLRG